MRVLLVDDDVNFVESLQRLFKGIEWLPDIYNAVELSDWQIGHYDLVLIDCEGTSASDINKYVKKIAHPRILMISGVPQDKPFLRDFLLKDKLVDYLGGFYGQ